jgi:hypothetical protein
LLLIPQQYSLSRTEKQLGKLLFLQENLGIVKLSSHRPGLAGHLPVKDL